MQPSNHALKHSIVAPNGIIYVKPEVRKGLLGRMLTELLDTRIMVKHAMKSVKNDKVNPVTRSSVHHPQPSLVVVLRL